MHPEDDAWALLEKQAAKVDCPMCGHHGMQIAMRLKAKPVGQFSLSGSQMKFSANEVPVISCPACGIEGEGNLVHE